MWFIRVLGVWSLLAAMVALTIDGTKSIAGDGELIFTALGEHWFNIHAASLNNLQAGIERNINPYFWDPIFVSLLQTPSWIFFTVLGLLLYWAGRRRKHRNVYTN